MTKKVFNWRALVGLMLAVLVMASTIPPLFVYLGWIDVESENIVSMVFGCIIGFFWPYPMFIEKEIN